MKTERTQFAGLIDTSQPMDPELRLLQRFRYPVNLAFAFDTLSKAGIAAVKNEEQNELWVDWQDYERAQFQLRNLNLDDEPISPESEGYIAGYEEWINKQYLPGYFTGTRMPVWFKDKGYWKYFGPGLFLLGLFTLGVIVQQVIENQFNLSHLVMGLVAAAYVAIGFYMVKATWGKPKSTKNQKDRPAGSTP